MLANQTYFLPRVNFRRARRLPAVGRVLVRPLQSVGATEVIAETYRHNPHVLIDVARALGVSRSRFSASWIECKVGEVVQKGDELARRSGPFRRVVTAPTEGEIVAIHGGQIILELRRSVYALPAGLPGIIAQIYPDQGALIESNGSLVQGVWGNRKVGFGMLSSLVRSPEDELTLDRLDVSLRGSVVLAGHCRQAEVLQMAEQLPLRGLILASMPARFIPLALELNLPLILIEGFGRLPFNQVAYDLLTRHHSDDAAMNAQSWDPSRRQRPEILFPQSQPAESVATDVHFKPQQRVRLLDPLSGGQTGTLIEILPGITRLANGVCAPCAHVRLDGKNRPVPIPLANLDVLE